MFSDRMSFVFSSSDYKTGVVVSPSVQFLSVRFNEEKEKNEGTSGKGKGKAIESERE